MLEIIKNLIKQLLQDAGTYHNTYEIGDVDFYVEPVINSGDNYYSITVYYKVYDKESGKIKSDEESILWLPKSDSGLFLIDSKFRFGTNVLSLNMEGFITTNYIFLSDFYKIVKNDYSLYKGRERIEQLSDELIKTHEAFNLTDRVKKKFEIYLGTQNLPDRLSITHIDKLIALNPEDYNWINYEIKDFNMIFEETLDASYYSILKDIRHKFYRNNKIYFTKLQTVIKKFFNAQLLEDVEYDEGGINLANYTGLMQVESLKSKVKLDISLKNIHSGLFDLIDLYTPLNGSINQINELNQNIKLENGKSLIRVLNKLKEPVWIEFLDYVKSKICINDGILPTQNPIEYKYRGTKLKGTLEDIDYYDDYPNNKVGITSSQIPLLNYTDPTRVFLAGNNIKQAIEVENAELALVYSKSDLKPYNVIKSEVNGTVTSIKDGLIEIDKSSYIEIPVHNAIYNTSITFKPTVKVGQKIKVGDIVANPTMFEKGDFKLGINARVAMMDYKGLTYEDAIVISKTCSKKLMHHAIVEEEIYLPIETKILKIASINSKINHLDEILVVQRPLQYSELAKKFEVLTETDLPMEFYRVFSKYTGYIFDIQFEIPGISYLNKTTQLEIKNSANLDRNLPKKFSKFASQYYKQAIVKTKEEYIICRVKILAEKYAVALDKLSNRYGAKGIISEVLDDEKMPYFIENGNKVYMDAIISYNSTFGRKIYSQIIELKLTSILEKLQDKTFYDKYGLKITEILLGSPVKYEDFDFRLNIGNFANTERLNKFMDEFKDTELDTLYLEGIKIRGKVATGKMYFMRLYQQGEEQLKLTVKKELQFQKALQGHYRYQGQKLGEQEIWALLGHSVPKYIETIKSSTTESFQLYNEIMATGYYFGDESGNPIISEEHLKTKRKLNSLINRFQK